MLKRFLAFIGIVVLIGACEPGGLFFSEPAPTAEGIWIADHGYGTLALHDNRDMVLRNYSTSRVYSGKWAMPDENTLTLTITRINGARENPPAIWPLAVALLTANRLCIEGTNIDWCYSREG